MVINGAIVSDLDMMYIESVLQVSAARNWKHFVGLLMEMRALFTPN